MALRLVLALATAACLASAAGAATPDELGLAKTLKGELQRNIGKQIPGTRIVSVACKISRDRSSAACTAHFTRTSRHLKGVYRVTVVEDASGSAIWQVTSASCTNVVTGKKLACR